jgi:hypothetical protein
MKTPVDILTKFENASDGLIYGDVTLKLSVKQGKPRYVIAREESCIPTDGVSAPVELHSKEENKKPYRRD